MSVHLTFAEGSLSIPAGGNLRARITSMVPTRKFQTGAGCISCFRWICAALLVAAMIALPAEPAAAAVITKLDNANNLNLTTSWSGSVVPGTGDTAQWDTAWTGASTPAIGAGLSWGGIKSTNPQDAVTIGATALSTLTLGTSGIDMTAATQDLTIAADTALGAAQT